MYLDPRPVYLDPRTQESNLIQTSQHLISNQLIKFHSFHSSHSINFPLYHKELALQPLQTLSYNYTSVDAQACFETHLYTALAIGF